MSTSNAYLRDPLAAATPANEWAQDTTELIKSKDVPPITQPSLSRGESQASTVPDIPGGWGRDWYVADPQNTDTDAHQVYSTFTGTLTAAGQAIQNSIANLTSTNNRNDDHPASGPVGAPAHPSTDPSTGVPLTQRVQETVGSIVENVRGAVAAPAQDDSKTEKESKDMTVAGLLPPPDETSSREEPSSAAAQHESGPFVKTGGAKINTEPPSGDMHPATSDNNHTQFGREHQPHIDSVSPLDGVPRGETRANLGKAEVGNYAYTDLPTKEGNVVDPHAGETSQKGLLQKAKDTVGLGNPSPPSGDKPDGPGYLQQAMTAVGLGGVAGGTAAVVDEAKDKEKVAEVAPATSEAETKREPSLDLVGASKYGEDRDVQTTLAKTQGDEQPPSSEDGVQKFNTSGKKERNIIHTVTHEAPHQTGPIQTTSNVYRKHEVANSPKASVEPAISVGEKERAPIQTTTNTVKKAAPVTSPATTTLPHVTERTSPAKDRTGPIKPSPKLKTQDLPDPPAGAPPYDAHHARDTTSTTATTGSSSVPTSASSGNDVGHKRRASFKDKFLGEVKVITGKLSRNEAKVEEGKALKSGGATSPVGPHFK
ncbi:hypothetical protein FRB99_001569 [Tulasnella sp. 403]|nr:hypothetical protein FRB99_001569 [Tulasnella sp. 403]